jgi:para-aminobenzoate synthetase component 1
MRLADRPGAFFLDSALPNGVSETFRGDPFDALRNIIAECRDRSGFAGTGRRADPSESAEHIPFTGGLVGYLGYDLRHFVEKLPQASRRDQRFPDIYLAFYDSVLCCDEARRDWWLFGEGDTADILRRTAAQAGNPTEPYATGGIRASGRPRVRGGRMRSNLSRDEYLAAVQRIIDYITAGDIFQANFSRRFECEIDVPASLLYTCLRESNPAPFAAYIDVGDGRCVMSSSPERFLQVDGRRVETRPIKGTRPRLEKDAADAAMKRELLNSEKDAAELAMIVDLERNDLGRVCEFGTVRVDEARTLETYATVHHLVATVTGTMREGCDIVDLLRATFPGGSITGAPKIRAMEIIDELEPTARSIYTGAIGCIGLDGRADLNIAIRTLLLDGSRATFQVGGGIVADSQPEAEYQETMDKGMGIMRALGARPSAAP